VVPGLSVLVVILILLESRRGFCCIGIYNFGIDAVSTRKTVFLLCLDWFVTVGPNLDLGLSI